MGCSPYFGDLYKRHRARGKKANTAILAVARRMARITWQLLTQQRTYTKLPVTQAIQDRSVCGGCDLRAGSVEESRDNTDNLPTETFPSRSAQ